MSTDSVPGSRQSKLILPLALCLLALAAALAWMKPWKSVVPARGALAAKLDVRNPETAPQEMIATQEVVQGLKNGRPPDDEFLRLLNGTVNNRLVAHLKAGEIEPAQNLATAYIEAVRDNPLRWARGENIEEVAGNLLAAGGLSNDTEILEWTLAEFADPGMKNGRLAFNMACGWAILDNKKNMLFWTRKARSLGKPKEQFLAERDFDSFRDEPEFLAAIQ